MNVSREICCVVSNFFNDSSVKHCLHFSIQIQFTIEYIVILMFCKHNNPKL